MISIKNYTKEDGTVDWKAFKTAQIEAGEICLKCGAFILFDAGYPQLCIACQKFEKDDEVRHEIFVRCPYCRDTFDPTDSDYYELLSDGEHIVSCPDCEKEYEISTAISWLFTSPPMENTNGDS